MLCEDKLPESTGDKLTARGDGSNFPGETGLDSPGEVLNCIGYVLQRNLTLIPWRTEQSDCLDNSLLPLFLRWEMKTCGGN